jgi:hypothetical protein
MNNFSSQANTTQQLGKIDIEMANGSSTSSSKSNTVSSSQMNSNSFMMSSDDCSSDYAEMFRVETDLSDDVFEDSNDSNIRLIDLDKSFSPFENNKINNNIQYKTDLNSTVGSIKKANFRPLSSSSIDEENSKDFKKVKKNK